MTNVLRRGSIAARGTPWNRLEDETIRASQVDVTSRLCAYIHTLARTSVVRARSIDPRRKWQRSVVQCEASTTRGLRMSRLPLWDQRGRLRTPGYPQDR